ncbi:MAG TPA: hypothetical protein PK324_23465, partial [Nocardioides sp.]|nr:hypothetical protein [Nocardioides sp.]
ELRRRLRGGVNGGEVWAPAFDHRLPDPVADAIAVPGTAGLVVTEGNYLLLDEARWRAAYDACDAVWHLVTDDQVRTERLVRRHHDSGKDPRFAREWVARVDQPNADQVEAAAHRADLVLDLGEWSGRIEGPAPDGGA